MGQQQLLLLVLGIVIVGIAVVAGIQAFSEGKAKAAQDAAVSDAMRIISDVQAWKLKPGAFGGGGDKAATNFEGVDFKALGYPVETADQYQTVNGCYKLAGSDGNAQINLYFEATTDTLEGADGTKGTADDTYETICDTNTEVAEVTVTGTSSNSIGWTYK